MLPGLAKEYALNTIAPEMARGLKHYLEVELFPRIHFKLARGISVRTCNRIMTIEGFTFTEHMKALYFDGHERPDVVEYCQHEFIPTMDQLRVRFMEYVVGKVEEEVVKDWRMDGRFNCVEKRLVLCAHDEMTAQANDGKKRSWVLDGEHTIKKKGVGQGMHQSDVICSTVGWLKDASESLEYGKNYNGYWDGQHFCTQLKEKIIPVFEKVHGAGYRAVFLINNSQGHSAYSSDALLVTRMNLNPGGKQARMRNGWFTHHGQKVTQPMVFPASHPDYPNQPKGIKIVLQERGLWRAGLLLKCKDNCDFAATACCAKRIMESQSDFKAQRSLVQEIIEAAGHLCIFLPKYHCELNFIELFWGAVKKYLCENCDYTFDTLKANLPTAMASVSLNTIRQWEHRMVRWIDAYWGGLGAKDAQKKVKEFSSKKYKSHRRPSERVARLLDEQM